MGGRSNVRWGRCVMGVALSLGTVHLAACSKSNRSRDDQVLGDGGASATAQGAAGSEGVNGMAAEAQADGSVADATVVGDGGAAMERAFDAAGAVEQHGDGGCNIPVAPSHPELSDAERVRMELIEAYCASLARDCSLRSISTSSFITAGASSDCSTDELLSACVQDRLQEYRLAILPACNDAWESTVRCLTAATPDDDCGARTLHGWAQASPDFCAEEKDALRACEEAQRVTGTQTSCDYGPGPFSDCRVSCGVGLQQFELRCGGPEGVPLRCDCNVNGQPLGAVDFLLGLGSPIYASDCADAAAQASDGACTNRLNCCFQFVDGDQTRCLCGSDPMLLDFPTCEAAAGSVGGEVVDICPQYEPGHDLDLGCWPPPCSQ